MACRITIQLLAVACKSLRHLVYCDGMSDIAWLLSVLRRARLRSGNISGKWAPCGKRYPT